MSKYPQSDKFISVAPQWDIIHDFLDSIPYHLATSDAGYYTTYITESTDSLLYKYFGIDPVELEKERRSMLENLRGML